MSDLKFKALEDAVSLVAQLVQAVIKAPKPLSAASFSNLFPMFPQFEALLPELSQVVPELEEVDLSESESLLALLASNVAFAPGKDQDVANASLGVVKAVVALVEALKEPSSGVSQPSPVEPAS